MNSYLEDGSCSSWSIFCFQTVPSKQINTSYFCCMFHRPVNCSLLLLMVFIFGFVMQCLNNYGSDISKCQFYLDMLNDCRKNSGSVMGAWSCVRVVMLKEFLKFILKLKTSNTVVFLCIIWWAVAYCYDALFKWHLTGYTGDMIHYNFSCWMFWTLPVAMLYNG